MTIVQKLQAKNAIARIARQQGISTSQCRAAIQDLIDQTWTTSDPEAKYRQIQLVGDSHIPSPEELILLISQKLLDK
jgi:hypothetical protein